MGRGKLTSKVQEKAKECLGREISLRELRLMPYIQFVMMNEQKIEREKINKEEQDILSAWRLDYWIEGGLHDLRITKNFWDAINEICFIAYVDLT